MTKLLRVRATATLRTTTACALMAIFVATVDVQAAPPTERRGVSSEVVPSVVRAGLILGLVVDETGAPLTRTLVSASGPTDVALAITDVDGRFEFRGLEPGLYLLRAHQTGFAATERTVVSVAPGASAMQSITMRTDAETQSAGESRALLTAGFGTLGGGDELGGLENVQPDPRPGLEPARRDDDGDVSTVVPHDHSERAWRLRRARRSVLKDEDDRIAFGGRLGPLETDELDDELETSDGAVTDFAALRRDTQPGGSSVLGDLLGGPLSGQLQLLTRATLDSSAWLSVDTMPGQVAYVSLGSPTADRAGGWGVRGAIDMTSGSASSWVLAGSYDADPSRDHLLHVAMSYSKHRLGRELVDTALGLVPPDSGVATREAGSVVADGLWAVSPRLQVGYGANLARYDYLEDGQLLSPRAQVTVAPVSRTRVRVAMSQNRLAPGAEEFLPPASGVWLPPERSFTPLSAADPLQVETARHLEVALEREIGAASVVAVRRFYQDVNDQMIAMFGVRPGFRSPTPNHYYLTSARGVNAEGWGVTFSHDLMGRVQGAVDYSVTRAEWSPWSAAGLSPATVGVFRTGVERFHDVTTSIQTEIPETSTRVYLLCRVNTAFSRASDVALTSGLDARFDVRVTQALPFEPFDGSQWELLVAMRSLFREQAVGASAYDELLVVSPPKQFMGGLVVNF